MNMKVGKPTVTDGMTFFKRSTSYEKGDTFEKFGKSSTINHPMKVIIK